MHKRNAEKRKTSEQRQRPTANRKTPVHLEAQETGPSGVVGHFNKKRSNQTVTLWAFIPKQLGVSEGVNVSSDVLKDLRYRNNRSTVEATYRG